MTDTEYNTLLVRVVSLERLLSDLLTASKVYITQNQVNQLTMMQAADIEALEMRVEGLEAQLELIVNA